ncbi:MAG: PorV/PorQ family protein [Candidatus Glassbacteria bacterium]
MRKRLSLPITGLLILLTVSDVSAQAGSGAEFLTYPMGARAVGMGRAYTAVANDIQTASWNPAGLALLRKKEVSYSRLNSFTFQALDKDDSINNNLVSVGIPTELYGAFGFSIEIQNYGATVLTGPGGPEPIGVVDDKAMILYGFYATSVTDKLDLGIDYKFVNVDFGSLSGKATTSAVDFGALYRPFRSIPLQVGGSFRNLGFAIQYKDAAQKDPLPRRLRVGGAYDVLQHLIGSDVLSLIVATDVEMWRSKIVGENDEVKSRPIESSQYFGTEFSYSRMLFLRLGYIREKLFSTVGPAYGIGLNYKGIRFDLAQELGVSDLGDETHFTAGLSF